MVGRIKRFRVAMVLAVLSAPVWSGDLGNTIVGTPSWTEYNNGQTLSADTLNNHFDAIADAVNDNDARLTAVETAINNLALTRIISIPAAALSFDASDPITVVGNGLSWTFTFVGGTTLAVRSPTDYAGGDVVFRILFQTTTATAGVVNFFLRPTSYNSGEVAFDPGSVSCTAVSVSGSAFYEQVCTIPLSRLTKDWWFTSMQREGAGATYSDAVVVLGVVFEYPAVQ